MNYSVQGAARETPTHSSVVREPKSCLQASHRDDMATPALLLLLPAVVISVISVAAAQDLFPCEFQLDTRTPGGASKTPALPAVKAYIDECLSNVECPKWTYCSDSRFGYFSADCGNSFIPCDSTPHKCIPRLAANEECRIGSGDCAEGLYCAFASGRKTSNPICVPKLPRGAKCDLTHTRPCVGDLICSRTERRCLPFTTGLAGDKCQYDSQCNQERGFYCKHVQFPKGPADYLGTCTKKKAQGEPCDRAADNYECAGFCLRVSFGPSRGGFCMNRRKIGQSCTADVQCRKVVVRRNERTEDALCNVQSKPGSKQGVCVMESNLLRKPGQACDPAMDLCDARRKLRCEKFNGKFVCIQRSKLGGPCTRGSPYSFCSVKSAGTALECRRTLALTKKTPYRADVCSQVRVTVKAGEICNLVEHAICEKGTTCVRGPGIARQRYKYPPPLMAYCMKSVPLGGDCSNRFSTVCAEGSFCINKKCQKASSAPDVAVIFVGNNMVCTKRKCAPGLSCQLRFGYKHCRLQTVVAGPWKACSTTPTATIVSLLHFPACPDRRRYCLSAPSLWYLTLYSSSFSGLCERY